MVLDAADRHWQTEAHTTSVHQRTEAGNEHVGRIGAEAHKQRDADSSRNKGSDLVNPLGATVATATRQPPVQERSGHEATRALPRPTDHRPSSSASSSKAALQFNAPAQGCTINNVVHAHTVNITQPMTNVTHQQAAIDSALQSRILSEIQRLGENFLNHKRKVDVLAEELNSVKRQREIPAHEIRADRLRALETLVRTLFWRIDLTSWGPSSKTTCRMLLLAIPSIKDYEEQVRAKAGFEATVRKEVERIMYEVRAELKSGIVKHTNSKQPKIRALWHALEGDGSSSQHLAFDGERVLLLALFRQALTYDEQSKSYYAPETFWSDVDNTFEKHNTSEAERRRFLADNFCCADHGKFSLPPAPSS